MTPMKPEDVPTNLAETLADLMYDDAHDGCDDGGCHGTPHTYYATLAREYLADLIPHIRNHYDQQENGQ